MALIGSKLFCCGHNHHVLAISNKYCALARRNKDKAILTVIYVNISCYVKNEEKAIFAVIYIELLLFY
jgi:hypothetical protein